MTWALAHVPRAPRRNLPTETGARANHLYERSSKKRAKAGGQGGALTRRIRGAIKFDLCGCQRRLAQRTRDFSEDVVSKRTFQPHRKSRMRTHGFRKRMKSRSGREIIRRRRRKGRRQLTVSVSKK